MQVCLHSFSDSTSDAMGISTGKNRVYQPRTGRVIHPTHAEAYGQALNADAEGVGAYKPLSSSLMPIPKRPCGSKVKSQPTGEIIDTKPALLRRRRLGASWLIMRELAQ